MYKDNLGYEFGYKGLKRNRNLHQHDLEEHSRAYFLKDEFHLISFLIHDAVEKEVSLSVWTIDNEQTAKATLHLTPRKLIKSEEFQKSSRNLQDSDDVRFVAYDYTSSFGAGGCMLVDAEEVSKPDGTKETRFTRIKETNEGILSGRLLPAELFDNCFEDQENTRVMDISMIADLGYFNSYAADINAVRRSVEVIISNVNLIYFFQFNIQVRLQQLLVVTESIGNPGSICVTRIPVRTRDFFSMDPRDENGECCTDPNSQALLTRLETFVKSGKRGKPGISESFVEIDFFTQLLSGGEAFNAAHWHYLTDCFSADCGSDECIVGVAPITGAAEARGLGCTNNDNFGMSSRTFQTWVVVAHELAHNFGGVGHTFQRGVGRTGGLMDYGDGKIDGTYTFSGRSQNEFCTSFQSYLDSGACNQAEDYFGLSIDGICIGVENFTRVDSCGICVNEVCEPLQLLVKVNTRDESSSDPDLFFETILTEPSEFSPIDVSSVSAIVQGELAVSSPLEACSALQGDFVDKIVIVERGGCVFTEKVENVLNAGAVGVIVFNSNGGAPKAMGGDGSIDIAAVSVSRNDGRFLIDQVEANPGLEAALGGFAASDEKLDFNPESIFDEYRLVIVSFSGLFFPCIVLWFTVRGRDVIVRRMKKTGEAIVDTAIDNKYRLIEAYDRLSLRLTRSQAIDPEELLKFREAAMQEMEKEKKEKLEAGDSKEVTDGSLDI